MLGKRKRVTHVSALGSDGTEVWYPGFVKRPRRFYDDFAYDTVAYDSSDLEDTYDMAAHIRLYVSDIIRRVVTNLQRPNISRRRLR